MRNVVCRIAASCRTSETWAASAGRVTELLLGIFRRLRDLVEPAVDNFFALWSNDESSGSLIERRVKEALGILKVRSNYSEEDRRAYHVILTAVAPPFVTLRQNGSLSLVANAVNVPRRKGKKRGRARRLSALELSHRRREFIERVQKGDFKVGDEVSFLENTKCTLETNR